MVVAFACASGADRYKVSKVFKFMNSLPMTPDPNRPQLNVLFVEKFIDGHPRRQVRPPDRVLLPRLHGRRLPQVRVVSCQLSVFGFGRLTSHARPRAHSTSASTTPGFGVTPKMDVLGKPVLDIA